MGVGLVLARFTGADTRQDVLTTVIICAGFGGFFGPVKATQREED